MKVMILGEFGVFEANNVYEIFINDRIKIVIKHGNSNTDYFDLLETTSFISNKDKFELVNIIVNSPTFNTYEEFYQKVMSEFDNKSYQRCTYPVSALSAINEFKRIYLETRSK